MFWNVVRLRTDPMRKSALIIASMGYSLNAGNVDKALDLRQYPHICHGRSGRRRHIMVAPVDHLAAPSCNARNALHGACCTDKRSIF